MKSIIAAAALAAALASPAFAQSFTPEYGTGNAGTRSATMRHGATSAYAWAPSGRRVQTSSTAQDRWLAPFGDATDHLLPGEIDEPGPR
jgi:opacity protein-like surface antigen